MSDKNLDEDKSGPASACVCFFLFKKLSKMLLYLRRFALSGKQPYLLYVAKDHDNCKTPVITRNSLTDIDTPVYYDTKKTSSDEIRYSIPLY